MFKSVMETIVLEQAGCLQNKQALPQRVNVFSSITENGMQ
jgi:hypothetical protein